MSQDKNTAPEWIPVAESLPVDADKNSVKCLVFCKYWGIVVRIYNQHHKCWDDEDGDDHYCDETDGTITHWMELPSEPQEKQTT